MGKHQKTVLDKARDELYSHIHRCAVLDAGSDEQEEWMDETVEFMRERYPELNPKETRQLRELGMRFCQPVIPHGKENTAGATNGASAATNGAGEANVA